MRITRSFLLLTVGALAIAACGGGGGDAEETTTTAAPTTTTTTVPETTTTVAETTTTEAATTTTELPRSSASRSPVCRSPAPTRSSRDRRSWSRSTTSTPARTTPAWPSPTSCTKRSSRDTPPGSPPCSIRRAPTRSARSVPAAPRTCCCSRRTTRRCSCGAAATPTSPRIIDESTLINMGPSHADGYFRGPGSKPHNLYNATDAHLGADAARPAGPAAAELPVPARGPDVHG